MNKIRSCTIITLCILMAVKASANYITANPSDYTSYLPNLAAGDTLFLLPGTYKNNLTLNSRNGTQQNPIVIIGSGNSTIFQGQSCCNTVSITKCSYLVIKNFQLDGVNEFVDALKAEGTSGNWAHHITIENLLIVNYGVDQQAVGISTKCSAWNWIIRKNKIIGAGTGIYLGNSNGDAPFVNGIIENNFIANTVGYNMEIKHQLNGVRDAFPGTQVDGKTIIRNNVFTKDNTSSTGGSARPNLLVGGFPTTGWGSIDYYEIYGNFFYNNPVEALFQGTGNIMMYQNIFVNHFDPSGFRAVYFTPQNGVSPQDIKVFHNTVWVANSSGGIRVYNPNSNYLQYAIANAVFGSAPISNFANDVYNIVDSYSNAVNYVLSANIDINMLDLYPQNNQLTGISVPTNLFQNNTDFNKDFNNDIYDWTYRGAYSGCCNNTGWKLQLDTIPGFIPVITTVSNSKKEGEVTIYPNPFGNYFNILLPETDNYEITLYNSLGEVVYSKRIYDRILIIEGLFETGIYYYSISNNKDKQYTGKLIKN